MSKIAPRTPETDQIYDCLNDSNKAQKLENDIALSALALARAAYDSALEATALAEGGVAQKKALLEEAEVNVEFLKVQVQGARDRVDELAVRFQVAVDAVTFCNENPDNCTVAEKTIKVLSSTNASALVIDNNATIARLDEDIEEEEAILVQQREAFANIETASAGDIEKAQQEEIIKQGEYVEARQKHKGTQEDLDELTEDCKLTAFHTNQDQLDALRLELLKFDIKIEVSQTVSEENDGLDGSDTIPGGSGIDKNSNDDDGNDCRYKPISQCQGDNIKNLTESQRQTCREQITPVCFDKTYESDWQLDFWSFLFILPAIVVCIFEEDFTYGLCVGSSAYTMNLKYLQAELGIPF